MPEQPAPAPAPAPRPAHPPGYPPPGYPPPGYPPPSYPPGYPPPGYPPPAYGQPGYPPYPPPYGYPPGYFPYPPQKRPEPKPRYPDDAAADTSPFIEMLIGGQHFSKRFSSYFNVGLQLGMFLGGRVRIAVRGLMFPADPDDEYSSSASFPEGDLAPGFFPMNSEPPSFLFGGSAGIVLASTPNFVLAPSAVFVSTDQADDYGSFLGVGLPFDWVTDSGLRVGFEVMVGRGFDGSVTADCQNFGSPAPGQSTLCDPGEQRLFDREAGAGFYSHFQLGWGFNRPKPSY